MNSTIAMLQIKHIKESSFEINKREGRLFDDDGRVMTSDKQNEFIKNNIAIGYQGNNIALRTWAAKHSKGLVVRNIPGETVEQKRQFLWQAVQQNELDSWLISLIERVKQGNIVTVYYLSSYDKPVAELIQRFVAWYIQR
ncbi:hypothetical protein ACE1CD_15465 [Aerosakkonema sp. BLCC-F183]|uniref:hypothetical protein n=1 Tax=Aerosakkonema sp. BLCC-F183 TaxID=3342834 RepID=UPI0035B8B274